MPVLTLPLQQGGPLIDALINVSKPRAEALAEAKLPIPQMVRVRGLIDTGASCTGVDPSAIEKLEIQPSGQTTIVSPTTGSTPAACPQFDIALVIPLANHPPLIIEAMPVISTALSHQGIQALFGRGVLSRCQLVYIGTEKVFTLAY